MSVAGLQDDYPRANKRWTLAEFQAAYDATPASVPVPFTNRWDVKRNGKGEANGMFWQSMAIAAGRTWWGTYRFALRHGFKAKVAADAAKGE